MEVQASELRSNVSWVKGKYRGNFVATCETISDYENGNIEIKPIPITEEILLKGCGIEHHTELLAELYDLSLPYLGFAIEPHADDWMEMWSKMAVHEFQNWWKSNTDEELNIQL